MSTSCYTIIVFLTLASCLLPNIVNAVSYGPSLVSLTRWDRLVRGPTIFNPDTGRVILLEDYPHYSVVIPLAPENPIASSNQVFISRRVSGPGEFHVEAPPGYGVMAVVQSLDLRVADDACNDFLLFSDVDGGGIETTGTCGKVDIRDGSHAPQGLIGPRTFISFSGKMRVLFYHGFIWGLVRNFNFDLLDPSLNPTLRVEIAFTAFKECPSTNITSNLDELPSESQFISCTPNFLNNTKTCIRKELFCDRTLNCGFNDEFGSDEELINCNDQVSVGYFQSQHSPPTTVASDTEIEDTTKPTTTTTTTTTSTTTEAPSTTSGKPATENSTAPPPPEAKYSSRSTDTAGLIGLVQKYPQEFIKPKISSTTTEAINGLNNQYQYTYNKTEFNGKNSSAKMPYSSGGELFVDVKTNPVEDVLVNGVSKEEERLLEEEYMSTNTIAGIIGITAVILLLIGVLRVYYCYNKVIWNPHGNFKPSDSPPESPNPGFMRKIKNFAGENGDLFSEKKGMGLKEQPPSYEILFPLPEEKISESVKV